MYLRKTPRAQEKIYLSIVKSFRDPISKKAKSKSILSLGYIDELEKEYEDPIAHFTELARRMTEDEKKELYIDIKIDKTERMSTSTDDVKKIGFT